MDMKKILQAFDNATTNKPAVGVNDMKRFVSIIKESSNPYNPVEETVINSFEAGTVGGDANEFLLAADKINDEIMAQVNKIKIHADEANLRDMMDKFNTFMTAYHNVGKEIIQPDMFNDSLGEVSDRTLKNYSQDAHTQVQGAKFGKGKGTPDAEKIIAKREKGMAAAGKRQQARRDAERANYKRPEPAKTSSGPQDWYGQNRYMSDSVEEGSSDFVSDAIEALRSSAPGLKQQDFLDELYMYIENQYGQRAAEMMSNAGQDAYDEWYDDYLDNTEQSVAEGVPQPGPSSGAPKQFGSDAKIQTRQMTVKDIISSVPDVPYYNNVVDDWDAKDYSWGVTKKVIEYATYLKDHPESLAKLPPAIVLNGKFEDGAHRVSAIWLLQQRMDPKNPLWKNAKLNVQFVEQGVAEGFPKDPNAPKLVRDRKTGKQYDPNKEFEKKMNSPEVMAQMKRMAQKEGVAEGLSFKDYLNLAEAKQKGVDGKACWDGYKRMGTKKKGGKTVDNCVPTGKK